MVWLRYDKRPVRDARIAVELAARRYRRSRRRTDRLVAVGAVPPTVTPAPTEGADRLASRSGTVTLAGFAVLSFAAYRLALAVTTDDVTGPWRDRIARRYPPTENGPRLPVVFVNCGRCVGTWTALVVVAVGRVAGLVDSWPVALVGWPAVAGAVAALVSFAP